MKLQYVPKKGIICRSFIFATLCFTVACTKFLDIVPDNAATLDNAFKLRDEAEKYLFTCYSFLPKNADGWYNAALTTSDEIWYPQNDQSTWHAAFRIAQGEQNASTPYFDEWAGARKGRNERFDYQKIWSGIRQCNIFLENVSDLTKVRDLSTEERSRWLGEVEFLKAFYHYYMLRMYGPIPIVDKSTDINAEGKDMFLKRMPVDSCVNYISSLLQQAANKLPVRITDENNELGRITQPIALAVKAKLLVMAASPLFNGNPDYVSFKDKDGVQLISSQYDATKWVRARDALKEAIESAESNGNGLYRYRNDVYRLSDTIQTQLNIRNAITTWWNPEIVWSLTNVYFPNEAICTPPMARGTNVDRGSLEGVWAAPVKIAKMFYTKNGIPIEEDKTLNYSNYMQLRTATDSDKYYIEPGYVTARLNYDREPRFYACLGFDGGIWYMKDSPSNSDEGTYYLKTKNTELAGYGHYMNYNQTGYFIKKLVNWESTTRGQSKPTWKGFPWPEIRMADLYLLYAETLNEIQGGSSEAISYVDKIRDRAGLKGVRESWNNYSNNPTKYTTKEGLRQIIQKERSIELVFEGQRLWDLKRWKLAGEELNKDITGMNIFGKTDATYNQEMFIFKQSFIVPRDYFWPIGDYDIRRNDKLVENPGW